MLVNRFREETSPNYIPKHLNRYPSFYFSNLAPPSQSLKISCKTISLFLGKQLLKYLIVNCLLKGWLFCKIKTRVSQDIKRMREEKGGNKPRREKCPLPLRNPKSCIPPSFLLVVQQTCKAKLFFLVTRTWKPSDFKNYDI